MIPLRIYAYASIVALLLAGLAYYRHSLIKEGEAKVVAADEAAVKRQAQAVADAEKLWAMRLQGERVQHDAEVASVMAPVAITRVVRCNALSPGPVPGSASVPGGASPASGVVPGDADVHPDIAGPLQLLARRADKLAADARELNALTH